jgi:predicted TIM-barrel fold metal-dependent hydrolase
MKIFDAHFHIIDPMFPLFKNKGFKPPFFTVNDYREYVSDIATIGGAVVSGSFQRFDQSYLIAALEKLGPNYYGVANIPSSITNLELEKLGNTDIVAVRFNLKRGGSENVSNIISLSNRLFDQYGWHTELYVDGSQLAGLNSTLALIPSFSIDHLGVTKDGLPSIYYWAEKGVKIKATGFGRIDFNPIEVMKKIHAINPSSLMFGTDLPSTRANRPFSFEDLAIIEDNFELEDLEKILFQNAQEWYIKKLYKKRIT